MFILPSNKLPSFQCLKGQQKYTKIFKNFYITVTGERENLMKKLEKIAEVGRIETTEIVEKEKRDLEYHCGNGRFVH